MPYRARGLLFLTSLGASTVVDLILNSNPSSALNQRAREAIYSLCRRHWRPVSILLGSTALGSLVSLVEPLAYRGIIDSILKTRSSGPIPLWLSILFLTSAVSVTARWIATVTSARLNQGILLDLDTELFDRIQRMPYAFFTKVPQGALISRMTNDVEGTGVLFSSFLSGATSSTIQLVGAIVLVLSQDALMALTVSVMFLLFLPARYLARFIRRLAREQMSANARQLTWVADRVSASGSLLVRLFGDYGQELERFTQLASVTRSTVIKSSRYLAWSGSIISAGARLATITVLGIGSVLVHQRMMSVGTLVLFIFCVQLIYQPISSYSDLRYQLVRGLVSLRRVYEVLDFHPYVELSPPIVTIESVVADSAVVSTPDIPALEFDHVSFKYPAAHDVALPSLEAVPDAEAVQTELVLDDVSFKLHPGKVLAIVGPSGAGKSTVAMLAAGMYSANTGTIRLRGQVISGLDRSSLSNLIGLVSQDTFLFHDTIRANLLFANPIAGEAELVTACRAAGIHDFIRKLPSGYNTTVGERGARLSGGQRQRVAIARVLLKAPCVVVLDEATAHLDSESEAQIQETFRTAFSVMPRLVIAHRLSTVVDAAQILVINKGCIVESGRHQDLLEAGGLYSRLYMAQSMTAGMDSP